MTKLFTAPQHAQIGLLQGLLQEHGIACTLRNELLYIGRGDLAFTDTWPQLWVVDDADLPAAQTILQQWQHPVADPSGPWKCPQCGEESEAQFAACWNCGHEKP